MSIVYKDILGKLKSIGLSSTKLRRLRLLSESTITKIRRNQSVSLECIDIICNLLHCQPKDIIEIRYDKEFKNKETNENLLDE